MPSVLDILLFRAGYNTSVVVIGVALLGAGAGIVGSFAVLRKRAMMADALSHATLPGIALAFMLGVWLTGEGRSMGWLLAGAAATGVLGVLAATGIARAGRLRDDAAIGAVLSVFFGAGVVLLSVIQSMDAGNRGGLAHFILGQTAAMSVGDAQIIGAVGLLALAVVLVLFKELRLAAFDEPFARSIGRPVASLDLLVMALVVLVTVVGLQAVGLVLVVAMLVIPAAAARFWTDRLGWMVAVAAGLGAASGAVGAAISARAPGLPTGGIIVLVAGALFALSMLAAPKRGVLSSAWRQVALRLRVATHHLLRDLDESGSDAVTPTRRPLLWLLVRRGMVRHGPDGPALTELGRTHAARLRDAARGWQRLLRADPASGVLPSADAVEHVLSADMIRAIERAVAESGPRPTAEGPP